MRFMLPDGVEYDGRDELGHDRFRVAMPLDGEGFFGRECPSCGRVFLVSNEDYEALPDDLVLWCVYCGFHDDHSEFLTSQQKARVMSLAEDIGVQMVHRAVSQAFGRLGGRAGGSSLVTFRAAQSAPRPRPLPGIREEQLVRQRSCVALTGSFGPTGTGQMPANVATPDR